jgi:hypothetical protein
MLRRCSENTDDITSDLFSLGYGVVRDTFESMLDLVLSDETRFSQQGGKGLRIVHSSIREDVDQLHYKVAGGAVSLYLWYTGQVRDISIWTLLAGIQGESMLEAIRAHPSYMQKVDSDLYSSLKPWLLVSANESVNSVHSGVLLLAEYLTNFVRGFPRHLEASSDIFGLGTIYAQREDTSCA